MIAWKSVEILLIRTQSETIVFFCKQRVFHFNEIDPGNNMVRFLLKRTSE